MIKWCASCVVCQKTRSGTKNGAAEGVPTSQESRPLQDITMDLVQIEDAQMLVVECMFSRFLETQLLQSNGAEEV